MSLEQVVKYEDRDRFTQHEGPYGEPGDKGYRERCGGELERAGVELFRYGGEGYQCKAIMANGAKIPGHFGKEAKRRSRKR